MLLAIASQPVVISSIPKKTSPTGLWRKCGKISPKTAAKLFNTSIEPPICSIDIAEEEMASESSLEKGISAEKVFLIIAEALSFL
ncbi:MAG: hypothetical protein E7332_07440 [Clostridiales bacterium]|nr:hypothetical protein [Clostridiales bacterium]